MSEAIGPPFDSDPSQSSADRKGNGPPIDSRYDRAVLIDVITYHRDRPGPPPYAFSCACGWGARPEHLGQSYAAHIADVYEASVTAHAG